jgi:8-oxo-dGTP diphosphatase
MSCYCGECGARLPGPPPIRCASCGQTAWNDAKPCGCALVTVNSGLLLIRRAREPWKGLWDVPGGFCNPGEHPAETARREVLEETALRVRIVGFPGMWLDEYAEPRRAVKQTLNIFYHAVPEGDLRLLPDGSEVEEARFFRAGALPEAVAFPCSVVPALRAWRRAEASGTLTTPLPDLDVADRAPVRITNPESFGGRS